MSRADAQAYIGLGGNLGDAAAAVNAALDELRHAQGLELTAVSSLYRSAPVDASGPDYVNAVAALRSAMPPQALLELLLDIEARHGRQRPYRHAPRTLDLDLLLYGELQMHTPSLTLPHPRMHLRAFVLQPLAEIAPALEIPGLGAVTHWLARVGDQPIERMTP